MCCSSLGMYCTSTCMVITFYVMCYFYDYDISIACGYNVRFEGKYCYLLCLLLMDRPFLPVNLKWLRSNHYLHHYHSPLHHQGSVHHSWWLCRYDILQLSLFISGLLWFQKSKSTHIFALQWNTIFYPLWEREIGSNLKKCGVVSSLLFFIRWSGFTCTMQVARQLDTRIETRLSVSSPWDCLQPNK